MLKEIIRKEILEHLLGLRFALACIICLAVTLTSMFVRGLDYSQDLDDYHQNVVMDRQALGQITEPWYLVWRNTLVNLKPNPMKIFIQGMEPQNGGTISLMGLAPARPLPPDLPNATVPLFPFVDMVFFVGVIMSLMAIIFGYNAISGEKENGTLRLMLSYSVPRDILLLGKWLGGYLTLIIPFLLTVLGMVAMFMIQRSIDLSASEWIRFMVFALLSLLYLAAMYSLSIWISAITRKSATSIIVLMAMWVTLVLAIPNLSPYLSTLFGRSTSVQEANQARLEITKRIWDTDLANQEEAYDQKNGFTGKWWEKIDWEDPAQVNKASDRWILFEGWEKEAHLKLLREFDKQEAKYQNEMQTKVNFGKWIGRLSPYACFNLAALELGGEGLQERTFRLEQIHHFHQQFVNYSYDEALKMERYFKSIIGIKGKRKMWTELRAPYPEFVYHSQSLGDYIKPVLVDAMLLAVFTVVFFMLGFIAFLRYDVR